MLITILTYFFAALMFAGAIAHLVKPQFYKYITPSFIPLRVANILSFIAEGVIGVLLVLPDQRKWGALAFVLLMIIFLPIHIWDYQKEKPFVGSKKNAIIRLIIQMLMIYGGWLIYQSH